ncbi:MAG: double-strand break repair protein AddB [Pseudomonadota bacterium]
MILSPANIYNIPAGLSFVECLAEGVLHLYGDTPELLAQTTIFLPSKRGIRALKDAFARRKKGRLMILPTIESLGDGLDEEPSLLVEDEISASHMMTQRQLLNGGVRQLAITRLIIQHIRKKETDISYAEAFALAASMTELLDALYSERIPIEALKALNVGAYAKAWQDNLNILNIITDIWGDFLAQNNIIDAVSHRNAVLETLTESWRKTPPDRPIIVAGSTGSMSATADFMKMVIGLPKGALVLPGFDPDISPADWARMASDHPQYGLNLLLDHLECARDKIVNWFGVDKMDAPCHIQKRKFLHEIMRPSGTAEEWQNMPKRLSAADLEKALDGLHLIQADTHRQEATAIALILRETLETPGKTAALITPNRILVRQVKAELLRWGIVPDDSAGMPLSDLPQGVFVKLLFDVIDSQFSPISLLAFLKHPFICMGQKAGDFKDAVRAFENDVLRGASHILGLLGLRTALTHKIEDAQKRHKGAEYIERLQRHFKFIDQIENVFRPFLYADEKLHMRDFITYLTQVIEVASSSKDDSGEIICSFWSDDAGRALEDLLATFMQHANLLEAIPFYALRRHLQEYLAKISVRPAFGLSQRLFIWGTAEARLQQTDILILGGLTEGSWPISPDPGIWISRAMRQELGLSAPERRIGLSAHDFVQASCAKSVYLTTAKKADGAPLIPSRWLIRLENIIKGLYNEALFTKLQSSPYLEWAAQLDHSDVAALPASRPQPKPPLAARPRILSVTDIEDWVRDPYKIYAKYILGLKKKDDLEDDKEALERGNIIHSILFTFVDRVEGRFSIKDLPMMENIIQEHLLNYNAAPSVKAFLYPRLMMIGKAFINEECKRLGNRTIHAVEKAGEMKIEAPKGTFILKARADRIDTCSDGVIIVDYKSSLNASMTMKQIENGLAPQLPLQAIMIERGGFQDMASHHVSAMEYIGLTGKKENSYEIKIMQPGKGSRFETITELLEDVYLGFTDWIARFDDETTPYTSRVKPKFIDTNGDYDHLARTKEWSQNQA